jgi:CBS domain containing-hemolysin-like protein
LLASFCFSSSLPEAGESFDYKGWRFEVVDIDGRRIDKVLAIPPRPEQEG